MSKPKTKKPPEATVGAAAAVWTHWKTLHEWPDNPRRNEPVVPAIVASLIEFGWGRPLVARLEDKELCVGHTAWKAARTLAEELKKDEALPEAERRKWHEEALRTARTGLVPVRFKSMTPKQAHALARADNRLGEFSEWDDAKLLRQLEEDGADLATLEGWDEDSLAELKRAVESNGPGGGSGANGALTDTYGEPPFSILDTRSGRWQERKREWLALGLTSEVGRGENLLKFSAQINSAHSHDAGGPAGISIFDPVLCELSYAWFSGPDAAVLDPFAGGSVRGIVAAALGRKYTGLELRAEQVKANREQWKALVKKLKRGAPPPRWSEGESFAQLKGMPPREFDFIFSCPPYMDLERYSDDPQDLSTLEPKEFDRAYSAIITEAVRCLKDDRFACFVVSEVRAPKPGFYRQLPAITIRAFEAAGARYYNEAILVNAASSLRLRVAKQMEASRKLGRTHQNVLVFCKGDPVKATKACGPVTRVLWADEEAPAPAARGGAAAGVREWTGDGEMAGEA